MDIVTYSLSKNYGLNSDIYYNKVADFTDEVLKEGKKEFLQIVEAYGHSESYKYEPIEERILELLILGVLMRVYYSRALSMKNIQYKLLTKVNNIKMHNKKLRPQMNYLKGIMSTLFLYPKKEHEVLKENLNIKGLHKLKMWLEASGEFTHEVKRVKKWEVYINTLTPSDSLNLIKKIYDFSEWFQNISIEILGEYTSKVDKYLGEIKNKGKLRADILLLNRKRIEYHLNMVGAEIMNRIFREEFISSNKKVLLLPICMTSPKNEYCKSKAFGRDFKCEACSSNCQVNKLTLMGHKYGFSVMVVPHESSISQEGNNHTMFNEDTGVIGVACILNLISGGWLLKDMNVPAQCVLLDYCGCKNHWHDTGISTCINLNKLKEIIAR